MAFTQEQLEAYWAANPEAYAQAKLDNPEAFAAAEAEAIQAPTKVPSAGTYNDPQYEADMLEYQRQRAELGLPYESWTDVTGRGYANANAEDQREYEAMLAEAEALRAEPPSTINEMGFDTSSAEWEAGIAKYAAENPDAYNQMLLDQAAQQQADAALEGQAPIKPIDPDLSGKALNTAEALQNQTIEENKELVEENTGPLGNNLQLEPDIFATQEQIDEIRALEKKIADDTGGSLQYGDYGRMSIPEAQAVLDGLKESVNWDYTTGAPDSGLYNPVPGPQDELLGPDGVEYVLPERPEPTFPGTQPVVVDPINEMGFDTSSPEWEAGLEKYAAENPEAYQEMVGNQPPAPTPVYPGAYDGNQTGSGGTQGNQATALRQPAPLDFSRGNPFQGAAYDVGFQDFNTIEAQQQSMYNNAGPAGQAQQDILREVIGAGGLSDEQNGMIRTALRQQQGVLDQRQAGWDATAAAQPGKANTTGGTALMPTYTGAQ